MNMGKLLLLSLSPVFILLVTMKTALLALSIIIFIDLLTGIRKSHYAADVKFRPWKASFWQIITSKQLRSTWKKATEYVIGILAFALLDSMVFGTTAIELLGNTYSIAEVAVAVACLVEIYSIYENMEAVSGNNLFKSVLKLFPQRVKSIFKKGKNV